MQILVLFFLEALVVCYGEEPLSATDDDECTEKTVPCVRGYFEAISESYSDSKRCKELAESIACLEKNVEAYCAGNEPEDRVKSAIEDMKKERDISCDEVFSLSSEDEEIQQCFEANEKSAFECFLESMEEVHTALENRSDIEDREDRIKCGLFMRTGECTINRIKEKCGDKAADEAIRKISDIPDEIKEACETIGIALHSGALDEDKRKK